MTPIVCNITAPGARFDLRVGDTIYYGCGVWGSGGRVGAGHAYYHTGTLPDDVDRLRAMIEQDETIGIVTVDTADDHARVEIPASDVTLMARADVDLLLWRTLGCAMVGEKLTEEQRVDVTRAKQLGLWEGM